MSVVSLGCYRQPKKLHSPFIIGDLVFDYVTNLNIHCFLDWTDGIPRHEETE